MKKLLFVAILGLIAFSSNAQENQNVLTIDFDKYGIDFTKKTMKEVTAFFPQIVNDLEYQVKSLEEKGEWDKAAPEVSIITLTNNSCGQSITLIFNNSFSLPEILQVCTATLYELCHPCP